MSADPAHIRIAEALLFAAAEPLDEDSLAQRLPEGTDVQAVLAGLVAQYEGHGVGLIKVAGRWAFVTAPDLAPILSRYKEVPRKLSRAAVETLAIIAYHQPVTRAEIEEVRGVAISKGTLDTLLETGWVRLRGRRKVPGRPVTYGVTDEFLIHFGLESLQDLPGIDELKAAGLLDSGLARESFTGPMPGESMADADTEVGLDDVEEGVEEPSMEEASMDEAEPTIEAETAHHMEEAEAQAEAEAAADAEAVAELRAMDGTTVEDTAEDVTGEAEDSPVQKSVDPAA